MPRPLAQRLLRWLLPVALFVAVPMLLFFGGFSHIERLHRDNLLKEIEQSLESEMLRFEAQIDTEPFLAKLFREIFYKASKGNAEQVFSDYRVRLEQKIDYLLWNASGTLLDSTISPESFDGDWKLGLPVLKRPFSANESGKKITDEEMINVRRLLGPQLIMESIEDCRSEDENRLLWCDSTGKRPLAWIYANASLSVAIFVKPEVLREKLGLDYYVKYGQDSKNLFRLGFVSGDHAVAVDTMPDHDKALIVLAKHEIAVTQRFETNHAIYFPKIIEDDLSLFAYVSKTGRLSTQNNAGFIAAGFLFLLLSPLVIMSGRAVINGEPLKLSISRKLALLFVYANGLPLAMLFFASYDFINQKEFALFDEIHAQGTRYLQNLDERFESEHALQIVKIQKAITEFKNSIRSDGLNYANYSSMAQKLNRGMDIGRQMRLYLIASESNMFGTVDSLYDSEKRYAFAEEMLDSADLKRNDEKKYLSAIGKFILSGLNGKVPDPRSSTEVELIAESAMQKPLLEVQHEFLAGNGKIAMWGMGLKNSPACINLISVDDNQHYDYMLIVNWSLDVLEGIYLKRQFLSANRNISDLQIGLINEVSDVFFPESFAKQAELRLYAKNFTHKPCDPRQFIKLDGRDYLIMGFIGKYLNNFNLLALYPVENIKKRISREKINLAFAGVVSLLLTVILGQFLAQSFLFPLQKLTSGAEAIRQRDFAVRLPPLGRDEFGEMAQIFNETMIDLEELKVAGVVQEALLPKKFPDCGSCKIYGQIVSMGDLGGDYFDYFNTSEGRFSVLVGDVAGRGAGAALIMAMAKAWVMQLQEYLEKPAELATQLHGLINASGRGSKKIMTFQYMNIAGNDGTAVYTNAGGWPPLIVSPETSIVREIDLPGPMLGALKRPKFSTCDLTFTPGEAVILYSDGVIEAKDKSGAVLGLNALKELVKNSYDADPAVYFAKLLEAHRNFTGEVSAVDDMTLLIVLFKAPTQMLASSDDALPVS